MPLNEDMIAATRMIFTAKEVVEADLIEARRALVGGDMASDLKALTVRLAHHDRRVPADKGPNPALDVFVAGEPRLGLRRNCVDVIAAAERGQTNLTRSSLLQELQHDETGTVPSLFL